MEGASAPARRNPRTDPIPTSKGWRGWALGSKLGERRKKDERAGEETVFQHLLSPAHHPLFPGPRPRTLSLSRASGSRIRKSLSVGPNSRISILRKASIGNLHTPLPPLPGSGVGLDFPHAHPLREGLGTCWKTSCSPWVPRALQMP